MRTCSIPYDRAFDKLVHGTCGLASEITEVNEVLRDHSMPVTDLEHFYKEVGDCFWMIAEICDAIEVGIDKVFEHAKGMIAKDVPSKVVELEDLAYLFETVQKVYQGHAINVVKKVGITETLARVVAKLKQLVRVKNWDDGFDIDIEVGIIMQMNINKLKTRYPEGFSAEKSLNRAEGDI